MLLSRSSRLSGLPSPRPSLCIRCWTSTVSGTSAPAPPLLLKIRRDLKTAMQNKDRDRLDVLRGLISDVTNATKTSNPLTTDMHILSLLRKRAAASRDAAQEFSKSGREDLKDREYAQVSVLEEYAGSVDTVSDEEISARIGDVINGANASQEAGQKLSKGSVMRKLLGPGGILEGKPVEKSNVAKLVDVAVGTA